MTEETGATPSFLKRHSAPLMTVGILSIGGIAATGGFHVVTGRGLGPGAFGLLAAFLAIVNIAAIGASALQNSVAVVTARNLHLPPNESPRRRFGLDSSTFEALVLGLTGTIVVAVAAPTLADVLGTSTTALYLASLTIIPGFLFSRAQGILQGVGDARSVAAWSTVSQILRLAFAAVAIATGLGAVTVLVAVLVSICAVTVGAMWQASRLSVHSAEIPFNTNSVVLLLLTISFAWITNIDVILVRGGTTELVSGSFAAAAVLTKMMLLIPTTLSLYLLPRFVARQGDHKTVRFGINVVLLTVLGGGLAMLVGVTVLGGLIVSILFGAGYSMAVGFLPWLTLAYLPWAMAQGLLIRLTATGSKSALIVLLLAAGAQWIAASILLPNVEAMIVAIGIIGALTLALFYVRHLFTSKNVIEGSDAPA